MKNFLFLTTTNLATNPRLTKELNLALTNRFRVTVLTFTLGNWSDKLGKEIEKGFQDEYGHAFKLIELDATRTNRFNWLFWALLEKCAGKIYPFFKSNVFINALASTRRSIQLLEKSRRLTVQPDLIIAHNMGALYPAYRLGKIRNIPFIFDIEDYHPGELASSNKGNEKKRREFLLKKLLSKAKGITSASPLIGKYTLKLIGDHPNHKVILNSFPESEFIPPMVQKFKKGEPLKLIWFGQKIGPDRGLEQLFGALSEISRSDLGPISLTLIGDWDTRFKKNIFFPFQKTIKGTCILVVVQVPLPQTELLAQLYYYDIGLALELTGSDLNRQLCLTNKIVAYTQAGLYTLATNTEAQSRFIKDDSDRGILCGQSSSDIRLALEKVLQERETIIEGKEIRYKKGRKLGWEQAKTKLVNLWNNAIER